MSAAPEISTIEKIRENKKIARKLQNKIQIFRRQENLKKGFEYYKIRR